MEWNKLKPGVAQILRSNGVRKDVYNILVTIQELSDNTNNTIKLSREVTERQKQMSRKSTTTGEYTSGMLASLGSISDPALPN